MRPATAWRTITVPGSWAMQDTGDLPQYTNIVMPFPDLPPAVPDANPTGLYVRTFEVPERWAGRRIVLHIGAAESVAIVAVNDREVGIGKDTHLASEFEIGDVLVPGTNTLEVRVVKWSDASFIEDQDEWWLGGITRSVFLYATGRTYLADIKAIAGLADDLTTGTLELGVRSRSTGASGARLDGRGGARRAGHPADVPRRGPRRRHDPGPLGAAAAGRRGPRIIPCARPASTPP